MITDRQLRILNAIVEDYVDLDQPVGSKTLIERHHLGVSTATIRNEMKVLEDKQLISKAHTSSGRMPSELGFRYYVDNLLEETSHHQQSKTQRLKSLLVENNFNIASALSEFARELSVASQYTTLVMRPDHSEDIIDNIHLVRASSYLVIMIVVFKYGHVEHLHLTSKMKLTSEQLTKIANFVTAKCSEWNHSQFEFDLNSFADSLTEKEFIKEMINTIQIHIDDQSNGIYMGGKVKLINALNESNVSSIQPILQYIESNRVTQLLDTANASPINVKIGHEIDPIMSDIAIVTSEYHINSQLKGKIAVIGPTAMHYQNVIQLLNAIW